MRVAFSQTLKALEKISGDDPTNPLGRVSEAVSLAEGGTKYAQASLDPNSKHYGESMFRQGLHSSSVGTIVDEVLHYFGR